MGCDKVLLQVNGIPKNRSGVEIAHVFGRTSAKISTRKVISSVTDENGLEARDRWAERRSERDSEAVERARENAASGH